MSAPAIPIALPGSSGAINATDCTVMGFTMRETTGVTAAVARLRAGSASGVVIAEVALAPGESIRDWYGPSGIIAQSGIYYELISGTVSGGVQAR